MVCQIWYTIMCEISVKELLLPLQITGGTNRAPPKGIVGSEAPPKGIVGSEAPPKEIVGSEAPPKGIVGSEAPPKGNRRQ